MITGSRYRKEIKQGVRLVEATSGNTGIALAMIALQYHLYLTLIMTEDSTQERIDTMKAYGAEVILTPASKTIEYRRTLAQEMADKDRYFLLNQFDNPDNAAIHYPTTGPEICESTNRMITHFVSSM